MLRLRKKARELLTSEQGLEHRSKRPIEPEAVFGHIKWDNKFNRFTLRGLTKVEVEFGLVAISHNLRKLATLMGKNIEKLFFVTFLKLFSDILRPPRQNNEIKLLVFLNPKIAA